MIQATQLKRGMAIKHEGDLFRVVEAQHKTPGNLRGMVQARLRNLRTGSTIDHRYRSVDMVERAILDESKMEFLYAEGDLYFFMNQETYEQVGLSAEILGDAVNYLIPNILLAVEFFDGRPVGIELPLTVEMKVMETEPSIKGASVSNVGKPAKMESGLVVTVPAFISEGEVIRIDTQTGAYIERAGK
ncbi:MAG: elongation factor P [Vicinamibacteria bacterium]|nr:elongation factor P [Vicinamibacteria bacterium]